MAAVLYQGIKSLYLVIDPPVDQDTELLRDDIQSVKVWYSTIDDFNPATQGTLAYEGPNLSVNIPDLTSGTLYYVKYALISELDPGVFTYSLQQSQTVAGLLEGTLAMGYLTKPSVTINTAADGTGGVFTNAGGTFKVYDLAGDQTNTANVVYSVVAGSVSSGLSISINSATGVYTVTDLTTTGGTAKLRAVYQTTTIIDLDYTITKSLSGSDTTLYYLKSSSPVIYKDSANKDTAGAFTNITVFGKRSTGGVEYAYGYLTVTANDDIEAATATASSITTNILSTSDKTSFTVNLYANANKTGGVIDTENISVIFKGNSAISVELTNDSHVIYGDKDGNNAALALSGTDISVYEGGAKISYNPAGYDLGTFNTWKISSKVDSSGIVSGAVSDLGSTASVANLQSVANTVTTATTTFNIVGLTSSGAAFTANKVQSFSLNRTGATGATGTNSISISYTNDSLTVPTATNGSSPVWTGSGGLLQVYDGVTLLTLRSNTQTLSPPASGTPGYNLLISDVSGNTLTEPTITGATTTTATIGEWGGASLTVPTVYKITAYVRTNSNATVTISTDVSISPSKAGADSTVYYITTSSPVITKIAPDAATSGVHSSITIQGKRVVGSITTNYGWVTVTANGATETFPAIDTAVTAVTLAPVDAAAKTSYTIKMYNQAVSAGSTLLDTEVVNVVFRGAAGVTGAAGTRTAVLDMYIWSATTPTVFPSGSSTYTWSTAQFSDPTTTNSWLQIPGAGAAGQTLYIISQPYADTDTTLTSNITWATNTPRVVGVYGTNGSRTAVLEVYQWSATAPTTYPSGTSTYTWSTGSFTAPTVPAGWSLTPGASTPGYTLWGYSISYSDTNTTPTSSITWSPAGVYPVSSTLVGTRTAVLDLYQWATTTPTTYPSGSSTYTWSTAQFTSPATLNGWTQTPGAGSAGQTLYIITQTHVNSLSTSTSSITWAATTPRVIGVYGSTELTGTRTGVLEIYRWASTPPVTYPSGTSTYTWSNGSFTAPTVAAGWSVQPGAGSAGQTLYGYSIKYSDSAATATTSVTWNSDAIYAVGAAGQTGAIAVAAYKIVGGASLPAAPTAPTGTPISGNATGTTDWYTSPALTLTGTQWLFQAVGTLLSGTYTWDSQTFLATFKVGALSALSADLGSITAGSITGTTITGATIRTAASGSRVELNASDLKVYSGASAVLTIGPGAGSGGITSALYNYTATTANYFDSINSIVGIDISSTNRLNLGTANSYVATSFAPGATNTYELGGTGLRWQNIYTINAVTVGSDARLKTNIETSVLGLNFINALNPVSYKLIQGGRVETGEFKEITTGEFPTRVPIYQDVPGVRKHYGLIAQEVKVVLDTLNTGDFAGFVLENKDDPNSMHSLRYEEFISPLIKAVQELSAKVTALENRLNS